MASAGANVHIARGRAVVPSVAGARQLARAPERTGPILPSPCKGGCGETLSARCAYRCSEQARGERASRASGQAAQQGDLDSAAAQLRRCGEEGLSMRTDAARPRGHLFI
jgi:hypothetical protein